MRKGEEGEKDVSSEANAMRSLNRRRRPTLVKQSRLALATDVTSDRVVVDDAGVGGVSS